VERRRCAAQPVDDYDDFASAYSARQHNDREAGGVHRPRLTNLRRPHLVGNPANYLLSYEQSATLLVNDSDVPNIPAGYHMALVHGAKAEGFKLKLERAAGRFVRGGLPGGDHGDEHKYLGNNRTGHPQVPAYRP
jgi:hypothetical protein